MTSDILIAGLMVGFSITASLGIILTVARAIREDANPRKIKPASPETAPVLRPVSGW